MTRLPELNRRELLPADAQPTFDEIMASRGRITPTFGVMLHSPQVAQRAAHLGTYMRFESSLEPPARELAALAAAHLCKCAYEWAAHQGPAREHGVSEAAIAALGWRLCCAPGWTSLPSTRPTATRRWCSRRCGR